VRLELIKAFPSLAERTLVIPNWVDARAGGRLSRDEARARLGLRRRLAIGLVGQITPLKRQDLFIEAAARLKNEAFWDEVEFLIIGAAEEQESGYEQSLFALANKLGVNDRVRFMGYLPELPAHLPAFDIVVAPSENEAFSLVLIEAMNAGCAVIASRAGGMAEIVADGRTGLLVPVGDVRALSEGLMRLLSDAAWRHRLGRAAQMDVAERFDRERVIDRIEQLYRAD